MLHVKSRFPEPTKRDTHTVGLFQGTPQIFQGNCDSAPNWSGFVLQWLFHSKRDLFLCASALIPKIIYTTEKLESKIQLQCCQDKDKICKTCEEFLGLFWFIFSKKLTECCIWTPSWKSTCPAGWIFVRTMASVFPPLSAAKQESCNFPVASIIVTSSPWIERFILFLWLKISTLSACSWIEFFPLQSFQSGFPYPWE